MNVIQIIKKYSVTTFSIITYLIMILAVITRLLIPIIMPDPMLWILTAWSPTISAIIVSGLIGGWSEIKKLLKGFLIWKIGIKWYLAGFLLMIAPLIFAMFYIFFGGLIPGPVPGLTFPLILAYLIFTLFSGPLSEEAGWRGFALPRLESKHNALISSLILWLIWSCWHIPLYFIESREPLYILFPLYLVITILMTWGYNNSKGSLIITVIFHFSFNFNGAFITGYFGLLPTIIFYIGGGVMIGVYLIVVVVYFGPKKLSRKSETEMPYIKSLE
ncbi:MAG: CPBP family intramembrane glutamic endopeptidase [Promethearchaeota archaeon]